MATADEKRVEEMTHDQEKRIKDLEARLAAVEDKVMPKKADKKD